MRFQTSSLALLLLVPSTLANIANINIGGYSVGNGQSLLKSGSGSNKDDASTTLDLSVPGDNPLNFCADPSNDLLTIEKVDLSPNPPVPGQTLTITATGTFHKTIEEGAKVLLQVKYGLIRLINQEADLCEQITNVDLECPLEKGKMVITKDVQLPKEIPKGRYSVLADVYTKEKEKITCLTAQVQF